MRPLPSEPLAASPTSARALFSEGTSPRKLFPLDSISWRLLLALAAGLRIGDRALAEIPSEGGLKTARFVSNIAFVTRDILKICWRDGTLTQNLCEC